VAKADWISVLASIRRELRIKFCVAGPARDTSGILAIYWTLYVVCCRVDATGIQCKHAIYWHPEAVSLYHRRTSNVIDI
jgi:hypothetical protein